MTTKKDIREGRVNKSINRLGTGRLLKGSDTMQCACVGREDQDDQLKVHTFQSVRGLRKCRLLKLLLNYFKVTFRPSNQTLSSVNLVPTCIILNDVGNAKERLRAGPEERGHCLGCGRVCLGLWGLGSPHNFPGTRSPNSHYTEELRIISKLGKIIILLLLTNK